MIKFNCFHESVNYIAVNQRARLKQRETDTTGKDCETKCSFHIAHRVWACVNLMCIKLNEFTHSMNESKMFIHKDAMHVMFRKRKFRHQKRMCNSMCQFIVEWMIDCLMFHSPYMHTNKVVRKILKFEKDCSSLQSPNVVVILKYGAEIATRAIRCQGKRKKNWKMAKIFEDMVSLLTCFVRNKDGARAAR